MVRPVRQAQGRRRSPQVAPAQKPKAGSAPTAKPRLKGGGKEVTDVRGVEKKTPHSKKKPPAASASMGSASAKQKPVTAKAKPIPRIRIRLSAFDHTVLDESVVKIIETAERSGAVVHGPVPLPTQIRKFTLMRSTFAKKDARDQFEMRIHRRLIDLTETTFRTVDALQSLSLPNGVDVEIKMG